MPDIFDDLLADWRKLTHHESQAPAAIPATVETARTEGEHVSAVTDLQDFTHDLAAKAAQLEQVVLPAAAGHLAALEGHPVVDAILRAAHVPPEALEIVVATIDGLERLYKPAEAVPAPAQ